MSPVRARGRARLLGPGAVVLAAACGGRSTPHDHMVHSLRDLARAESTYYGERGHYTAAPESLQLDGRPFAPAPDVRLIVSWADARGWHAVTSNMETDEVCRLTREAPGTAPPEAPPPDCR
jgi:hypothetical protein